MPPELIQTIIDDTFTDIEVDRDKIVIYSMDQLIEELEKLEERL